MRTYLKDDSEYHHKASLAVKIFIIFWVDFEELEYEISPIGDGKYDKKFRSKVFDTKLFNYLHWVS